jgi:hypothetical protein
MGSKQTSQSNSNSSFTPPPNILADYNATVSQAQNVAATPYSAYGGQLVSPINAQQNTGIAAVNNASGIQNPANAAAGGLTGASAAAINPSQINSAAIDQYESPYQSDVINATEAEIQNQNQQQAAALQGNTISSDAFGGDRAGIAQAALAGQQDIASNATLANLNNQNYSQALGEANTQQGVGLAAQQNTAARQLAAGSQFAQLGQTAQNEALNEANAQTNAGTLQQTTQQAQDTAAYNQFLQQQAYPFETTGWLANIVEGVGSQSGGSSIGQTTTTGSAGSQIAGGLLGLASFLARGGRVPHRAPGGLVSDGIYLPHAFDPTAGAGPAGPGGGGIVPATSSGRLPVGHTMPTQGAPAPIAPQTPQQQAQTMGQIGKAVQGVGNAFTNSPLGDQMNDAIQDAQIDAANGVTADGGGGLGGGALGGVDPDIGGIGMMARGGIVGRPHFYNGGTAGTWNNQPAALPTKAAPPPTPIGNAKPANAPSYSVFPQQMSDGSWTTTQNLAQGIAQPGFGGFARGGIAGRRHYDDGGVVPTGDPIFDLSPESLLLAGATPPTGLAASYANQMPAPPIGHSGLSPEDVAALKGADAPGTPGSATSNLSPVSPNAPFTASDITAPGAVGGPVASSFVPPANAPLPPERPTDLGAVPDSNTPTGVAAPMGISPAESPRTAPISIPGNNPGNLVANSWTQSLPGYSGANGRFATFSTPEQGAAALDRNLQSYGAQGIGTPLQITAKWAPKGDGANDPIAYAGVIAKNLGIGINDPVNLSDPATRANIGQSIAMVEHGGAAPSTALAYDGTTGRGGGIANAPAAQAISAAAPAPGGIAAAPSTQVSSPQFPDNTPTPDSGRTGLFGLNLSPETRQLMLSAGLGIMGGTSRSFLTNVGQGATQGIAAMRQNQNLSSEAALRNTQTQGAQIENQMKAQQLKWMQDYLQKHAQGVSSNASSAAPAINTQTITAGSPSTVSSNGQQSATGATQQSAGVPDSQNPIALRAQAQQLQDEAIGVSAFSPAMAERMQANAQQLLGQANEINRTKMISVPDGKGGFMVQNAPGAVAATASQTGATTAAESAAKSQFEMQEVTNPDGSKSLVPRSTLLQGASGTPPIAANAPYVTEGQNQLMKEEPAITSALQNRQQVRQRMNAIAEVMQNYQTGKWAEPSAEIVANLRAAGIPIQPTDTANPEAYEKFIKNQMQNVFGDVKAMGGQPRVAEIQGFQKAAAGPSLQPGSNVAILGQGLGILDSLDKHDNDFINAKYGPGGNPAMSSRLAFDQKWLADPKNQLQNFVDAETKNLSYKGQPVPKSPADAVVGQVYQTPNGDRMRWTGTGWKPAKWRSGPESRPFGAAQEGP